jgi:hypothetical protein
MTKEKLYTLEVTAAELSELFYLVGRINQGIERMRDIAAEEIKNFTPEKFCAEFPRALITPEENLKNLIETHSELDRDFKNINPFFDRIYEAHSKIDVNERFKSFPNSLALLEHFSEKQFKEDWENGFYSDLFNEGETNE